MTAAHALRQMRADGDEPGSDAVPAALLELLRRRARETFDQELRRLGRRAQALSDEDLGYVRTSLDHLMERMLFSRLRAVPHLSEQLAALFAVAPDETTPSSTTTDSARRASSHGWMDQAACISADPELFYPIGEIGLAAEQVEAAKAVCAKCLVGAECLEFALATGEAHGVWGGTTPEERRAIRRLPSLR